MARGDQLRAPCGVCLRVLPRKHQTALRRPSPISPRAGFATKPSGHGIPDHDRRTDPDEVAAAFTWAAERARTGEGPTLIELVCFRVCGHAHHDDMLYLGKDTAPGWTYPPLAAGGYADPDQFAFWSARDPIARYAARLEAEGLVTAAEVDAMKAEAEAIVEAEARAVVDAAWPDPADVARGVFAPASAAAPSPALTVEPAPPFDQGARRFSKPSSSGCATRSKPTRGCSLRRGCGRPHGNAFLLLRPLLARFWRSHPERTARRRPCSGACVERAGGASDRRNEFNDFVATGLTSSSTTREDRYRWGMVPMVIRMPWADCAAGPYHSQNTEPWFFRTPGLKIVVPSTPHDARARWRRRRRP